MILTLPAGRPRPRPAQKFLAAAWGLAGLVLFCLGFSGCDRADRAAPGARVPGTAAQRPAAETDEAGYLTYPESDYAQQTPGHPGGKLRLVTSTDTPNLDPHGVSSVYVQWLGRMIFDNLVYLDAKGIAQPWIAKSWTVSPDGLTYTFRLRDDVTFSDGSRLDAEAVRLNFEHMRDPATKSPLAGRYIAPYDKGKVIDDFTFEARLSYRYTPFLNVLAQSWLALISPRQIVQNPRSIVSAPIGSGPFVLENYERQRGLTLNKRADYHWAPPVLRHEGPAYLDRIEVEIVAEGLMRYTGLASGQSDLLLEAPAPNAAAIRSDPALVLDRRIRQGIPNRGISFNLDQPPFNDVRVRRAISYAVDREGIVRLVGFGEYQPKADYLAATTRYYDPAFRHSAPHDPAKAAALLDEAGWRGRNAGGFRTKEGQTLGAEILVSESTPSAISVALQSDLRKVGFDLRIVQLPLVQITDRRNAGTYQATAGGVWHTNTPDALYILYHGDEITTPARIGQNSSHLRDPLLDDLLARARRETNPSTLQDLYSKAQGRLVELVPSVTLYENYSSIAYRRALRGIILDTSHNTPVFTGAWLDQDKS